MVHLACPDAQNIGAEKAVTTSIRAIGATIAASPPTP